MESDGKSLIMYGYFWKIKILLKKKKRIYFWIFKEYVILKVIFCFRGCFFWFILCRLIWRFLLIMWVSLIGWLLDFRSLFYCIFVKLNLMYIDLLRYCVEFFLYIINKILNGIVLIDIWFFNLCISNIYVKKV